MNNYQYDIFDFDSDNVEEYKGISLKWINDMLIRHGSGFEFGKSRIKDLICGDMKDSDLNEALAQEFGTGGFFYPMDHDGIKGCDYSSKGMQVTVVQGNEEKEFQLSWSDVRTLIKNLIAKGDYMTDEEYEKEKEDEYQEQIEYESQFEIE